MAMFAKYDGIDGESHDADHANWIDITTLYWQVQRPDDGAAGQSRRRGAAEVGDLIIGFDYEKAGPKLLEKCLKGEVVPHLEIELTATYGGERSTYLRYELKNVLVMSLDTSASGYGNAGPARVTLSNRFEEIKVTYTEFADDGSNLGNVETEHEVEPVALVESVEEPAKKTKKKKKGKKK